VPLDDKATRRTALEIMRYFDDHPQAADTAEWIHRWWLHHKGHQAESVQAALDGLVELGLVLRNESPGKPPVYSRAAADRSRRQ
jgi:hypothetical protein